jgi:chromosome segregation ATPase
MTKSEIKSQIKVFKAELKTKIKERKVTDEQIYELEKQINGLDGRCFYLENRIQELEQSL